MTIHSDVDDIPVPLPDTRDDAGLRSDVEALQAASVKVLEERIDVTNYGVVGDGSTDNTAAIATLVALNKELVFPPTSTSYKTDVVDLTGSRSVLVGVNEQSKISQNAAITGPLIDATSWQGVGNGFGWRAHRNLRLEGNGVNNAACVGININGSSNGHWQNINIQNTGAQAIYCQNSNWHRFSDVVVGRPVNDYPYIQCHEVNAIYLWENIGLRSVSTAADPAACVKYTNTGGSYPSGHRWIGTWLEFLHLDEGSTVFDITGKDCWFEFPWCYDLEATATTSTDTAIITFRDAIAAGATNPFTGGNHVHGMIWGKIQDSSRSAAFEETRIAYGVKIHESGTRVVGTRGFQGNNVYLAPGVEDCWIELGGSQIDQDDAENGVDDQSGTTTNAIIDPLGVGVQWGSDAKHGFFGVSAVGQQAHVADPSGGATTDAEARTAINSILSTLETYGFHATS